MSTNHRGPTRRNPTNGLFAAVLLRAVEDASGPGKAGRNQTECLEARRWLQGDQARWMASECGIPDDTYERTIAQLLEGQLPRVLRRRH